jgi:hypothetical protein
MKVESPTLMWGKMASCGFLSTTRKADYQSAARCHLAPQCAARKLTAVSSQRSAFESGMRLLAGRLTAGGLYKIVAARKEYEG